jgi:hypothetical protein
MRCSTTESGCLALVVLPPSPATPHTQHHGQFALVAVGSHHLEKLHWLPRRVDVVVRALRSERNLHQSTVVARDLCVVEASRVRA